MIFFLLCFVIFNLCFLAKNLYSINFVAKYVVYRYVYVVCVCICAVGIVL